MASHAISTNGLPAYLWSKHQTDNMRILIIHNFYQQFGGEDNAVLEAIRVLEKENEVCLYSRNNDELRNLSLVRKIGKALALASGWETKRRIQEIVKTFRPDVAYVHNIYPLISPVVYHVLHELRVPIVQVLHDFRPICPNGWFYNRLGICERCKFGNYFQAIRFRCMRNSYWLSAVYAAIMAYARISGSLYKIDKFLCLSEFSRQKLISVGFASQRILVLPHGIESSTITPNVSPGDYFAYLGRLSPEKGLWTIIRAVERLDNVTLKIAGTGPLAKPLEDYIRQNGISNIELVGFLSGSAKADFLGRSTAVVVASEWYEMFGLVILEAWAAGKPVIGSRVGSIPNIVEHLRTGLLFEPGNDSDLAGQIELLATSPGLAEQLGAQARKHVEAAYGTIAIEHKLLDLFKIVSSS